MDYRIYEIKFEDGHVYVGRTMQTLKKRFKCHKSKVNSRCNYRLYNFWRSYGEMPTIMCIVDNLSKEEAYSLEKEYIIKYIEKYGDKVLNDNIGSNLSEKTKLKISKVRLGKYTGTDNGFYGRNHSEETKALISKANKGRLLGVKNPMYGKSHSEETKHKIKAKLSLNNKGEGNPMYGKNHSEETKLKIKKALSREKDYFIDHPRRRPSFKRTCTRMDWNILNFEEKFHSKDDKGVPLYTYTYLGEDYIHKVDATTISKKPLEYWETNSTRRCHFKRMCKSRGFNIEDFYEILDEITADADKKKYFYIHK